MPSKTDIANRALAKIGQVRISSIDDPNIKEARLAKELYPSAVDEALRRAFWSFAVITVDITPEVTPSNAPRLLDVAAAAALGIDRSFTASSMNDGKPWYTNGTADVIGWEATDPTYGAVWFIRVGATIKFVSNDAVALPEMVGNWRPVNGATGSARITTAFLVERGHWSHAFALPSDYLKLKEVRDYCGKVDQFAMQRANGKRCLLCNVDAISLTYVQRIEDPNQYDPAFTAALVTLLSSKLARAIVGSDELETTLLQRYETVDLPEARTADGQDSESNENHPLQEILEGNLLGRRGGYFGPPVIAELEG